ncbi:MAG: trypsin-like peptidase domain-containing protein, partial [Solirubrobacteraceae bacterium]
MALGITGRRTTQTIVQEAPAAAEPTASDDTGLTPHDIYVRDAPGVVFVRAQVIEQVQDPFDLVPTQESSVSTGSGFLIDDDGHILTNYHVIEGADPQHGVTVQFEDAISRSAVVVAQDPDNDLAVLHVDMSGVPPVTPLTPGDSTTVRVGDPTLAIGNPFGLDRTLTTGIVSALQRQIQAPNGFAIDNVIQTDAPINPGSSGGPLLDGDGRVIGINSQIETAANGGTGSVGIAFAVPINTALPLLERLDRGYQVRIAYLGVTGTAAAGAHRGVLVGAPEPGGPAAIAGVKHGDVIEAISGQPVRSMDELQSIVAARGPGQMVAITIRRRDRTKTLKVLLGSQAASR